MIALEKEASLRIEPGAPLELACFAGVLWVTQEGDARDLFLAPGESFHLALRGLTIVTALEASVARVIERAEPKVATGWWAHLARLSRVVAAVLPRPRVGLSGVPVLRR